jgi:protein-L-isoaspartate O-methyltransferase
MGEVDELIGRLIGAGIHVPKEVANAMKSVDICDFTDFDCDGFYHDRPVVFLEIENGGVKTISAPHMIATLLHHLELDSGQEVVVYGAKGGYICALIAHVIGEEGHVTVLDPSIDVITHLSNTLRGYPTVSCHVIEDTPDCVLPSLNRVLVTGQISELPTWLSEGLCDGGFAIAPIGDRDGQRLIKVEKQGEMNLETDLGGVIFGPVDIEDTVFGTPSPEEMAELIENATLLLEELGMVDEEETVRLGDLIAELRHLPDDLPPPEELDDPREHPMVRLMMEEGAWFLRIWPMVQMMVEARLASPGAPDSEEDNTGHSDFIP